MKWFVVPPGLRSGRRRTVLVVALACCVVAVAAASVVPRKANKNPKSTVRKAAMAPIIGINAGINRHEGESSSVSVRTNYIDAITSAGGIPIVLPPLSSTDAVADQIRMVDGFVFIGGSDIDPTRYGAVPHPTVNRIPLRRENYDFELIRRAIDARKPFLAICLGCQQVNVALGGTLIQDIPSETSSTIQHSMKQDPYDPRHDVTVKKNTKLYELVETTTLSTNSSHHQAVKDAPRKVTITSHAADGIIESFELKDHPFGLGIQWHPERLTDEKEHLALFKGLVEAASKNGKRQ
jgi:putative glutamine amidotransferase